MVLLILTFCISSNIVQLMNYVGFATWFSIGAAVLCVPYLRRKCPDLERPIKVHLAFPIIYLIMTLVRPPMTSSKLYHVYFLGNNLAANDPATSGDSHRVGHDCNCCTCLLHLHQVEDKACLDQELYHGGNQLGAEAADGGPT